MLHIHCGDTSAELLRRSGVPGDVMVWCDPVCEGPLRRDAATDEWAVLRGEYLDGITGLPWGTCAKRLLQQQADLEQFREHEEAVLWFDACLFDQAILVRQLDWFARQDLGATKLSLICIGAFPGFERFRGLGELDPAQLASLLETRHSVSESELSLGVTAWSALCASEPTAIERVLAADTSALPYLSEALSRFLEQYPSTRNGLNRLEQEALEAVCGGCSRPGEIFRAVSKKESRPFFGDTTLWACIDDMSAAGEPLLRIDGPGPLPRWNPPDVLAPWNVLPTEFGRSVLAGTQDAVCVNGINRWLGGVYLCGQAPKWRWDGERGRLSDCT